MASKLSPSLAGLGERITSAVAESIKQTQVHVSASAADIGDEVGKHVAAALEPILSKLIQEQTTVGESELRERILSNAQAAFTMRYIPSYSEDQISRQLNFMPRMFITIYDEAGGSSAVVQYMSVSGTQRARCIVVQGTRCEKEADALMALYVRSKVALDKAQAMLGRGGWKSFSDLQ